MQEKPSVPDELTHLVEFVGSPVTSDDVEVYGEYREIVDRSRWSKAVIDAWERQESEERSLRKTYATWLMWAVTVQVLVANVAFFLIGFGYLSITEWVASVFFGAVFAEVSGLAWLVVRYLFPSREAAENGSILNQLKR